MRKVFSLLLALLSVNGFTPSVVLADSSMACEHALTTTTPGLIISTGIFSLEEHMNPANQAAAVLSLLRMTTNTMGEAFNKKLTLEKGELYLGQLLKSGWSLEYEYASDKRLEKPAYRLAKISIVKPNGEKNTFEKKPTTIDGLTLAKTRYTPEELGIKDPNENPFSDVEKVEAPAVIQGELLKAFLKFAPLAEYLKKDEVNSATSLRTLFMKGFGRSNVDFMKGVIKKQAFKYALLGVVLYGYYSQQDLVKKVIHPAKDSWTELKDKTDTAVMMNIISKYLGLGKKKAASSANTAARSSGSVTSMDETFQLLAESMKTETTAGGKTQIFVLDEKGATAVNAVELMGGSKNVSSSEEAVILVSLPSSGRMMLLQVGEDKQVITYGLDKVTSPNEYGAVKWAIDHAEK